MNFRELNLRIFRREPVDQILWQPRIGHWYHTNREAGTLPERYREMSLLEVFGGVCFSILARLRGWVPEMPPVSDQRLLLLIADDVYIKVDTSGRVTGPVLSTEAEATHTRAEGECKCAADIKYGQGEPAMPAGVGGHHACRRWVKHGLADGAKGNEQQQYPEIGSDAEERNEDDIDEQPTQQKNPIAIIVSQVTADRLYDKG